jgi:tetratricopeptide (TPR) repeat protein
VRSVAGQVVDRAGKPLAGVHVAAHAADPRTAGAVRTNDDGRFTLEGIHPEAGFVLLSKPEYRQAAAPIAGKTEALRVVLSRTDEAPTASSQVKTVRRSSSETRELMRKLLLPVYERVHETKEPNLDYFRREALMLLARHDPDFVREHVDEVKAAQYRADVLLALGEIDDALAVAETVQDGYSRTSAYLNAADRTTDPERSREILSQALVHARTVEDPAHRAVLLGGVAKRLLDAGHREAARRVLDDGNKIARELATTQWSGFARGNFAETLALVDPTAARELVKDLDESEHGRHHGNIAHRLAATNPEQAEEFLVAIRQDRSISPYGVRVCYRMAPVDLERARRIAAKLAQPEHRAHALGVMALAMADKDPDTARELLRDAFEQFTGRPTADTTYPRNLFSVAVTLVHVSERVDPASTGDYLARAIALHPGPGLWFPTFSAERRRQEHDEQTANLVMLLASYGVYPDETKYLADPIFVHARDLGGSSDQRDWYRAASILTAMALADPERAIAWFHEFYPRIAGEDLRLIPQPWMTLATAIGGDDESLWSHITHDVFHLWAVDKEDL